MNQIKYREQTERLKWDKSVLFSDVIQNPNRLGMGHFLKCLKTERSVFGLLPVGVRNPDSRPDALA